MWKRPITSLVAGILVASTGLECLSPSPGPLPPTDQSDSQPPPAGNSLSVLTDARSLLIERVNANRGSFFVYKDADSGFNHGFPSGFFGSSDAALAKINLDTACLDDPDSVTGCSSDTTRLDRDRGTVIRVSFDRMTPGEYVGVNIEEPENWGALPRGMGYDLTGATELVLDVRSPTPGGLRVQFGVGGKVAGFTHIAEGNAYTTLRLPLNTLFIPGTPLVSPPGLDNVHILFSVATNDVKAPGGGIVVLDNIRFEPVPGSQKSFVAFPQANEVFGVVHRQAPAAGRVAFPLDQVLANVTTSYESALTLLALRADQPALRSLADAFVHAVSNDNAGLPLPSAADSSTGVHNSYMSGDLALFNDQTPEDGRRGNVRLAGFTASPEICGGSGYCIVLDGATGGNNAFAMLALLAAYENTQDTRYLDSAKTIGRWMIGNLADTGGDGYGGFYLGYPDEGVTPKTLIKSKSTENNADIFAALTRLTSIDRSLGNGDEAEQWSRYAGAAAAFVLRMFDPARGCFFAGTVPAGTAAGPGIDPTGPQQGDDVINVFDFLDSNTFSTLALARAYPEAIDWRRPVQYVLDTFAQSVTAGGQEYHGFNITSLPTAGPNGIAWEFTGQVVVAMRFVDDLYGESRFENQAGFYLDQIRRAQVSAPFGDGRGLVASTLQDGDNLPPIEQCLSTPFQCIPERVGLAATAWAIFAEQNVNPLATEPVIPD